MAKITAARSLLNALVLEWVLMEPVRSLNGSNNWILLCLITSYYIPYSLSLSISLLWLTPRPNTGGKTRLTKLFIKSPSIVSCYVNTGINMAHNSSVDILHLNKHCFNWVSMFLIAYFDMKNKIQTFVGNNDTLLEVPKVNLSFGKFEM